MRREKIDRKKEQIMAANKMQVQAPSDMRTDQHNIGATGIITTKTNESGPHPAPTTTRMMNPNSVNPASSQEQVGRTPASVWISGLPKAVPFAGNSTAQHLPRNEGDAAWPPGRPPSSGSARIGKDQGTAASATSQDKLVSKMPMVTADQ